MVLRVRVLRVSSGMQTIIMHLSKERFSIHTSAINRCQINLGIIKQTWWYQNLSKYRFSKKNIRKTLIEVVSNFSIYLHFSGFMKQDLLKV